MSLSFLSNISVAAATVKSESAGEKRAPGSTARKQRQPINGADLRVWKDGSVYPSDALIAEFDLEYRGKDDQQQGFGFDVVHALPMAKQLSDISRDFLIISAVDRSQDRVDLFSQCGYEADGSPKTSVATQGSPSFGKSTLLASLKEVYDLEPNEEGYIDLCILREDPKVSPDDIFKMFKKITKGDKVGQTKTIRRENQVIYALVDASLVLEKELEVSTSEELAIPDPNYSHTGDASTTTYATEQEVSNTVSNGGADLAQGEVNLSNDAEKADPIDYSGDEWLEGAKTTEGEDPFLK